MVNFNSFFVNRISSRRHPRSEFERFRFARKRSGRDRLGFVLASGTEELLEDPGPRGGLVQEADPREIRLPAVLHAGPHQQEEGRGNSERPRFEAQKIVII